MSHPCGAFCVIGDAFSSYDTKKGPALAKPFLFIMENCVLYDALDPILFSTKSYKSL